MGDDAITAALRQACWPHHVDRIVDADRLRERHTQQERGGEMREGEGCRHAGGESIDRVASRGRRSQRTHPAGRHEEAGMPQPPSAHPRGKGLAHREGARCDGSWQRQWRARHDLMVVVAHRPEAALSTGCPAPSATREPPVRACLPNSPQFPPTFPPLSPRRTICCRQPGKWRPKMVRRAGSECRRRGSARRSGGNERGSAEEGTAGRCGCLSPRRGRHGAGCAGRARDATGGRRPPARCPPAGGRRRRRPPAPSHR